ncbi:hypothetical protein VPH35_086281 [Triticum aestivum]
MVPPPTTALRPPDPAGSSSTSLLPPPSGHLPGCDLLSRPPPSSQVPSATASVDPGMPPPPWLSHLQAPPAATGSGGILLHLAPPTPHRHILVEPPRRFPWRPGRISSIASLPSSSPDPCVSPSTSEGCGEE